MTRAAATRAALVEEATGAAAAEAMGSAAAGGWEAKDLEAALEEMGWAGAGSAAAAEAMGSAVVEGRGAAAEATGSAAAEDWDAAAPAGMELAVSAKAGSEAEVAAATAARRTAP